MEWFRWYHGAVSDDKWPLIARRSNQPVAVVVAVWAALLECASQAANRGSIEGFDPESMDALLQVDDGCCQAVLNALSSGKMPRIVEGRIARWGERQPQREDGSAERAKAWRDRKKAEAAEPGTVSDASRTRSERTPNARRTQTNTEQNREEKNREEIHTPATTGNEGHAHEPCEVKKCGKRAEHAQPDFSAEPGIEFQELRSFYDTHCREEAPLTGFIEYKQLRASKNWPGQSRIYDSIEAHTQADPHGWKSFAPGFAKFLREHWWDKKPRLSPAVPAQTKNIQDTLSKNMATGAAVLAAREARRKEHAGQQAN